MHWQRLEEKKWEHSSSPLKQVFPFFSSFNFVHQLDFVSSLHLIISTSVIKLITNWEKYPLPKLLSKCETSC